MSTPTDDEIRATMKEIAEDHVNPLTGELNCTTLAEDAADMLGEQDIDGEIPEFYYDLAVETETELGL